MALYEIVSEQQPMTVRQVFYQATVRGVVDKSPTTRAGCASRGRSTGRRRPCAEPSKLTATEFISSWVEAAAE
jgi:hypothetical protein